MRHTFTSLVTLGRWLLLSVLILTLAITQSPLPVQAAPDMLRINLTLPLATTAPTLQRVVLKGTDLRQIRVLSRDANGISVPVPHATVYKNGEPIGGVDANGKPLVETDDNGYLPSLLNLAKDDQLFATRPSSKSKLPPLADKLPQNKLDVLDTSLRLQIDTATSHFEGATVINSNEPVDLVIDETNTYILTRFDITASLEWQASQEEETIILDRLLAAANVFADATDGQFGFRSITIYNNRDHWQDADTRVLLNQDIVANTPALGFVKEPSTIPWPKKTEILKQRGSNDITFEPGAMLIPRPHNDDPQGSEAYAIAQELIHYYLGTVDEHLAFRQNSLVILPIQERCLSIAAGGGQEGDWGDACKETANYQIYGEGLWDVWKELYPYITSPRDRRASVPGPLELPWKPGASIDGTPVPSTTTVTATATTTPTLSPTPTPALSTGIAGSDNIDPQTSILSRDVQVYLVDRDGAIRMLATRTVTDEDTLEVSVPPNYAPPIYAPPINAGASLIIQVTKIDPATKNRVTAIDTQIISSTQMTLNLDLPNPSPVGLDLNIQGTDSLTATLHGLEQPSGEVTAELHQVGEAVITSTVATAMQEQGDIAYQAPLLLPSEFDAGFIVFKDGQRIVHVEPIMGLGHWPASMRWIATGGKLDGVYMLESDLAKDMRLLAIDNGNMQGLPSGVRPLRVRTVVSKISAQFGGGTIAFTVDPSELRGTPTIYYRPKSDEAWQSIQPIIDAVSGEVTASLANYGPGTYVLAVQ